ncbi:hypothetical protein PAXRUDRAFT_825895 [Paxillus rubicundulus Ve08.2h10]|uniref:Zn(2)-C6 fungal-type domain-containing protein n=1 Tax=Paxillus rubicundulus Ve08.2h10 TaxID=930991 RepID=A0A0D0DSM1_9AGAM|nr:hypothetical protein PAXRUDRAFT_825895 [Paxillus rubicundulus Ve08.2h10]
MSSSHHSGLALDQQYPLPAPNESYEQFCGTYPSFILPPFASDPYAVENFYVWQDMEGVYHYADARSDNFVAHSPPPYSPPALISEGILPSDHNTHRCSDVGRLSQPAATQEVLYVSHLAEPVKTDSGRPQGQDYRSSIARASDNFLAQASFIFGDGHSPSRRGSTLEYLPPAPYQTGPKRDTRPPSRKRSRESLDGEGYHVKEEAHGAYSSSLSIANDGCRLPQSAMIVPSQGVLPSSLRNPHLGNPAISVKTEPYAREDESLLRPDERCTIRLAKHTSNKRIHRSSEELVRQENTILSTPTTWPIPDDPNTKVVKKAGEQKKQALACLFCRERKIACGRPPAHSPDQTCNQCARRRIKCEYPTESRRGQHKRRRKQSDGEPSSQGTSRTNLMATMASTAVPLSSSTTSVTSST